MSLGENVTAVQEVVSNTKIYPGRWMKIKGDDITFEGQAKAEGNGGWFLAHGDKWWGLPGNNKQTGRPHWFGLRSSMWIFRVMD